MVMSEIEKHQKCMLAKSYLLPLLPHGSTIYTMLLHRSRNRMKGVVAVLIVVDGEIKNISGSVSSLLGRKWDDRDGIWVSNQFDVINSMSYVLHGYDDKGKINPDKPHKKATARRFKAGHTFEHRVL
jgi:hypothetical protein